MAEDGREVPVFYSLGNFLSHQTSPENMLGGMASVTICMDETGAYVEDYELLPTINLITKNPDTGWYNYSPMLLSDYTPELAGKEATFKCKIHEVKETIKPELDDEFAKDVSEYDTLAALKKSIKADLAKKRQEAVDRDFENEAVVLAGKNMTCNIPACMIDEQVDHQIEQFAYQLQSQGMKMEDYTKMIGGDLSSLRQSMRPMAEQTVRSDILLSEIARAENLEVTDEEVEEELKKLAEQYQMELDKLKAAVDTAAVKSDLMGKKAAKIITDNAVAVAPTEEKKDDAETSEKE